jgi:hypothetical protein
MLSLAPATPLEEPDPQPLIIDWAGARRVYADLEPAQARALAARGRGSARALFPERHATPTAPAPTPRDALLQQRDSSRPWIHTAFSIPVGCPGL